MLFIYRLLHSLPLSASCPLPAERIPCGEPEVPVEGEVEREGETKAMYTCRAGFRLEGDPVLTCSSKGKWEGQAPRCKGEYFGRRDGREGRGGRKGHLVLEDECACFARILSKC